MAPIRNYSGWNQRAADSQEPIEPYQKFFFICEGANTEVFYFKKLIDLRKQLGIHPLIDICLLEKTEEDQNLSNPKRLIEFAEEQKANTDISFDSDHDQMIVVIDADIYERKPEGYSGILKMAKDYNDIPAVTNPAFELFLLLHYEGSYEMNIICHLITPLCFFSNSLPSAIRVLGYYLISAKPMIGMRLLSAYVFTVTTEYMNENIPS